jgi:hypothetical protein
MKNLQRPNRTHRNAWPKYELDWHALGFAGI